MEDSAKGDSENQLKEFQKELQKTQTHLLQKQQAKEETSTSELVVQVFQGAEIHNER